MFSIVHHSFLVKKNTHDLSHLDKMWVKTCLAIAQVNMKPILKI